MSLMFVEIREQPGVLSILPYAQAGALRYAVDAIRRADIRFVLLAARGTSDHAAIYGKYLLEARNGYPVGLADTSVYTIYDSKIRMDNVLVIGVSQSGEATDVLEFVTRAKSAGALTLAITNNPDSALAGSADYSLCCSAGPERAVAATKTYTSTLALFYLLSSELLNKDDAGEGLQRVADDMCRVIEDDSLIRESAQRYRYMSSGVVISRGYNHPNALEMALKMAETSYLGMRGYSAADFLHGPVASVHADDPCFVIAPSGKAARMIGDALAKLRERDAETVVISDKDELLEGAVVPIRVKTSVAEELSPLLYIVPGQLFAYYLSTTRGLDPDNPRGLSKVTLTL